MKMRILAAVVACVGLAACDNSSTEPRMVPDTNPSTQCSPVLGGGGGKAGTDTTWVCQQSAPAAP